MELQPLNHQGDKEDQQLEQGGEAQHLENLPTFSRGNPLLHGELVQPAKAEQRYATDIHRGRGHHEP
eukprot:7799386-Prorocentrum_lima.AAC.1